MEIDIFDLEPRKEERGRPAALVRGVACALDERGASIGGFDASVSSALASPGGAVVLGGVLRADRKDHKRPL